MTNNEIAVQRNGAVREQTEQAAERYTIPNADIIETPEAYLLLVDMPGASKDEIAVKIERNELSIRAALPSHHDRDSKIIYRELQSAGYVRTFALGDGVDRNNVDAHFDLGVLTLKLFKSETMRPREITIN